MYPEIADVKWLEIDEPWSSAAALKLQESGAVGLRSYSECFPGGILDGKIASTLRQLGIRHLFITGGGLERLDLSEFDSLLTLEMPLVFEEFKPPTAGLQYLSVQDDPRNSGVQRLLEGYNQNLLSLNISYLRAPDLELLANFPSLKRLRLKSASRLIDASAAATSQLVELSIALASKLTTARFPQSLRSVFIETCRKLRFEGLEQLPASLTSFGWSNNNEVGSLLSLMDSPSLRRIEFTESTNVRDGRVKALAELPVLEDIFFQDRSHYDALNSAMREFLRRRRRLPH